MVCSGYISLVSPIVHFDVVAVDVDMLMGVVVNGAGFDVPRVTRHVIRAHQNNVRVGNAQTFDTESQTDKWTA